MNTHLTDYLIIGNGRMARHFSHYLHLMNIPHNTWHRTQSLALLNEYLGIATRVLLLIRDDAIENFANDHLKDHDGYHIHFSGSITSEMVTGAHPLQTFNGGLYKIEQYQAIPFVLDHDAPAFELLLPGLLNQHVRLDKALKTKYHALCVLSGNFSCLLWQKLFYSLGNELHLPKEIAHAYLRQQMQNLLDDPDSAFTGPLARQDVATIARHLQALTGDAFQEVYASFVSCYQKISTRKVA